MKEQVPQLVTSLMEKKMTNKRKPAKPAELPDAEDEHHAKNRRTEGELARFWRFAVASLGGSG